MIKTFYVEQSYSYNEVIKHKWQMDLNDFEIGPFIYSQYQQQTLLHSFHGYKMPRLASFRSRMTREPRYTGTNYLDTRKAHLSRYFP